MRWLNLAVIFIITCCYNNSITWMWKKSKNFNIENIILSLSTIIPFIALVWLLKVTCCTHGQNIYNHLLVLKAVIWVMHIVYSHNTHFGRWCVIADRSIFRISSICRQWYSKFKIVYYCLNPVMGRLVILDNCNFLVCLVLGLTSQSTALRMLCRDLQFT